MGPLGTSSCISHRSSSQALGAEEAQQSDGIQSGAKVVMSWADDEIAGPMGYTYCVGFDCARDAMRAFREVRVWIFILPENICPEVARAGGGSFDSIDQATGLARLPVHLYGYQADHSPHAVISLDPLMTGWIRRLRSQSAIISFGRKKMLSVGYGGAFLTNDQALAEKMKEKGHWNEFYTSHLKDAIDRFYDEIDARWEVVGLWDRYLGDTLIRIPGEQLMPWRVMRKAWTPFQRFHIANSLRQAGYPVGTNYRPVNGANEWGDTVLNFLCSPTIKRVEIQEACEIIKRVVGHTHG